jgi:RNA polymerase sigma-70 factor (ECF subfamily)
MQGPQYIGVVDGSEDAVLFQHHAPMLFTYLRVHISLREDAEDLLVDIFLAALEYASFSQMAEKEQILWLRRVAHNKVVDYYRRQTRRQGRIVALDDVAETIYEDDELAPEQISLRNEEYARLRTCLTDLPDPQQQLLQLRFGEGLRCSEIATIMGKREGTIRMMLSRTLNLLRTIYEKH